MIDDKLLSKTNFHRCFYEPHNIDAAKRWCSVCKVDSVELMQSHPPRSCFKQIKVYFPHPMAVLLKAMEPDHPEMINVFNESGRDELVSVLPEHRNEISEAIRGTDHKYSHYFSDWMAETSFEGIAQDKQEDVLE